MKTIQLILLTLFISLNSYSQNEKDRKKIQALKVAFISDRLDLTPSEAEKFWPIYNEYQREIYVLKNKSADIRKKGTPKNHKNISDKEAKKILFDVIEIDENKNKLTKAYITNLLKVLPAKKVILTMSGEKEFKRKMIEQFKQRHRRERSPRN